MKQRSRLIYQILSLTTLTVLMPLFQNCGAQRPSVEISSFATTGYSHSGAETSCNSCHALARPMSSTNFLAFNSDTTFNLTKHGGTTDCVSCHDSTQMTAGTRIKADWAKGYFDHLNGADCNSCHIAPAAIPPNNQPHPAYTSAQQCASCHTQALTTVMAKLPADYLSLSSVLWKGAAPGLVFGANSKRNINVYNPIYTSITSATNPGIFSSWAVTPQSVIMFMDHNSSSIPASMKTTGTLDCLSCHSADPTGFTGGLFHNSVRTAAQAQPSTCIDCHGSGLTNASGSPLPVKGAAASAFVGAGPKTNTTAGLFNHDSSVGKADCATCHAQTNWATPNWTSGKFHSVVVSQPLTCTECHAPKRPPGTVVDAVTAISMNHSLNGMGECASCHQASTTGASKFTTWQGGLGTPVGPSGGTSKLSPLATTLTKSGTTVTGRTLSSALNIPLLMDHASFSSLSCTTCHTTTSAGYAGAKFHKNSVVASTLACTSCHSNASTAAPGNVVGWDTVNLINKPVDHSHASLVNSDCRSCHATPTAAVSGINFKDGQLHSKLTTQPASCAACHAVKLVDNKIQNGVDHTNYMSQDCTSCHTFPGTGGTALAPNWKGAFGGANHTSTASCVGCHSFSGASNVYTFKDPTITGDTRLTVLPAMSFNYPAVGTAMVIGSYTHTSGSVTTYDCKTCHVNVPSASGATVVVNPTHLPPAAGAVRTFWKGAANWSHASLFKVAGSTDRASTTNLGTTNNCGGCHAFNPANTPQGLAQGAAMHTYSGAKAGQCGICHAISAGVTSWKTSYQGKSFAHGIRDLSGLGKAANACTVCHPTGW